MKRLAPRLALAVASLTLSLAFGELALRAFGSAPRAEDRRGLHEARPDRPWLYGMRPGAEGTLEATPEIVYRVNADGFRDTNYAREKPANTFRVLVLGDSVAFGFGVEMQQSFPKRMEAQLEARRSTARIPGATHIEVLNLGVSGYNPYTEAALLADVGPSYQPDLVLVQFCINDLNDPTLHFDVQARLHMETIPDAAYPDPSVRRAPPEPPGPLLRGCRRSKLCAMLDDLLLATTAVTPDDAQNRAAATAVDGSGGPEWSWLSDHYRDMADTSRAMGAEFAVLAFPYPSQLLRSGAHPVQQRLVALGDQFGWTTIDPLEQLRGAHRNRVNLFLDWWHPTPAGHELAAREAVRALACAGLLPEAARSFCHPRR